MTNGAATAERRREAPHLTAEGRLEEIVREITSEEASNFKDYLEYSSAANRGRMRYEQFVTIVGGTEKLFDDVYHNAYEVASKYGLKGKTGPKSVADTLELVVIDALKRIQRPTETNLWKTFEAMKANNQFTSDDDRVAELHRLATYLGANERDIAQFIGGLESGDTLLWNQAVRDFTNKLKEGVIDHYVSHFRNRLVHRETLHRFKAYAVQRLRELGATPDNVLKYLSPQTPVEQVDLQLRQLQETRTPTHYATLGLKEYKPPKGHRVGT